MWANYRINIYYIERKTMKDDQQYDKIVIQQLKEINQLIKEINQTMKGKQ